ncbi:hypothetical protein [Amycolatopsis granulosa]|uniref:hypothetical protein n=1 Tax=Amycolatopsis granulosa TaxID=185684 RepID=UPI001FBA691C|nr:hypothetical protein [Amycolatopsis granulosa]NIH86962.1 hypothetical protein [Amycolatopsis granulosa]
MNSIALPPGEPGDHHPVAERPAVGDLERGGIELPGDHRNPGTGANRDDLLYQAGERVYERLQPDDATIARHLSAKPDRETCTKLMRELVGRISAFRSGYLELLELRLEATRRPGCGRC